MMFYGPAFKAGRYAERVKVVDMAPTLARVAGVKPTQTIDGHVIASALR
jgi:arylsulfatase A-like enzyme